MIMIDAIDSIGGGMTVVAVIMVMTVFMVIAVIVPISVTTIVGVKRRKRNEQTQIPVL